ncbi:MAG: TPM domain-containing protein [Bacteroides sp.]|nr:TPM domain-containing protein [Bacteroides sp.]
MLKKITVSFLSAVFALLLAAGVFADTDPRVFIIDDNGHITEDEKAAISSEAEAFAEKSGFNVMIAVADDVGSPKTESRAAEYAEELYDEYFGEGADGVLLLINNDTEYNYITVGGDCAGYYGDYRTERIFDAILEYISEADYYSAALIFVFELDYYFDKGPEDAELDYTELDDAILDYPQETAAETEEAFVNTDPRVRIIDDYGYLSESDKASISSKAGVFAEKSGFNVMISITDDIGTPKTDSHTVEYADDLYEEYFGINTDGILLLINNDTKYDYISTSGACINYYSDYRIERILDAVYDDIVGGDFASASLAFVSELDYYYGMGRANSQRELLGSEIELEAVFSVLFFFMFAALVAGFIIYGSNTKKYKLAKASTAFYVNKNSLRFDQCTDVFMGNFTTRTYSPRSSGGSSGGSRGHSSTHHSHSGGRHGGGGRHR